MPEFEPPEEAEAREASKQAGLGRKWDEEIADRVLDYIVQGCTPEQAFAKCDISSSTLERWKRHYEKGLIPEYKYLFEKIPLKEKSWLADLNMQAVKRAKENDKVLMFVLERRDPDNWGKKEQSKIEITGSVNHVVMLPPTPETTAGVFDDIEAEDIEFDDEQMIKTIGAANDAKAKAEANKAGDSGDESGEEETDT